MMSVSMKMITCAVAKILLLTTLYTEASAAWMCPDVMSLVANLTRNGTFETEIGYNTTFPLLRTVNGSVISHVPWINVSRMWLELNFTAEQETPLTTLLEQHSNATSAGIIYNCNVTALNCTVDCVFGEQTATELGEESNISSTNGSNDVCTSGYHLEDLTNSSTWLETRWTRMCEKFVSMQVMDQSLAWLKFIGNETVLCEFNTSIPIRYNITLYGYNLTRVDQPCTEDENQTVMCSVSNSTRDIQNTSLLNCTIHRNPWPVSINAKFNRSAEEMEYYDYEEDNEDYYSFDDDGYDTENEESEDDGKVEEVDESSHESIREKRVGDPKEEEPKPAPQDTLVLVIGIIALGTVAVFAIIIRRKMNRSSRSSSSPL